MLKTELYTRAIHPYTGAVANMLAAMGVKNPATGQPFTEAAILGIGGGLGAGYILWEFKMHDSARIVMGFRNRWNYTVDYLTNLTQRLNAKLTVQETAGKKAAADYLNAALQRGLPFLACVDKAHMPHLNLPEALKGYGIHLVGVYGIEGDQVIIDDGGDALITIPADIFAAARAQIPSDKNRLLLIDPPPAMDVSAAYTAGIADHIEHLSRETESFSLPVYKKWAKLMTDEKNKKGWPVVFKARNGLYETLRSVYEGITLDTTEGSGLREMYADFLTEAAPTLNNPALKDAAAKYREAAQQWRALADTALPDSVPLFAETKRLMRERYAHTHAGQLDALRQTMAQLEQLENIHKRELPLTDAEVKTLFESMAAALNAVYDAEVAALETLKAAMA